VVMAAVIPRPAPLSVDGMNGNADDAVAARRDIRFERGTPGEQTSGQGSVLMFPAAIVPAGN